MFPRYKRVLHINFIPYYSRDMQQKEIKPMYQFLREKNLLLEYMAKCAEEKLRHSGTVQHDISVYNMDKYTKEEYNGKTYYYGPSDRFAYQSWYLELPSVYDDRIFKWKNKGEHKEAIISDGNLEFICTTKGDDVQVKAKYINNRNQKMMLEKFIVENACNNDIIEEIEEWKSRFHHNLEAIA